MKSSQYLRRIVICGLVISVLAGCITHNSDAEAGFNRWRRLNDRERPKKQDPDRIHLSDHYSISPFGDRPLFGENGLLWNSND
jgi:hypothetical protein